MTSHLSTYVAIFLCVSVVKDVWFTYAWSSNDLTNQVIKTGLTLFPIAAVAILIKDFM